LSIKKLLNLVTDCFHLQKFRVFFNAILFGDLFILLRSSGTASRFHVDWNGELGHLKLVITRHFWFVFNYFWQNCLGISLDWGSPHWV